jgi:hypothetical protein
MFTVRFHVKNEAVIVLWRVALVNDVTSELRKTDAFTFTLHFITEKSSSGSTYLDGNRWDACSLNVQHIHLSSHVTSIFSLINLGGSAYRSSSANVGRRRSWYERGRWANNRETDSDYSYVTIFFSTLSLAPQRRINRSNYLQ